MTSLAEVRLKKYIYFCTRCDIKQFQLRFVISLFLPTGSGRTLRDTALQSPPIMKLLTSRFVSTWSLLEDLKVPKHCKFCVYGYNVHSYNVEVVGYNLVNALYI